MRRWNPLLSCTPMSGRSVAVMEEDAHGRYCLYSDVSELVNAAFESIEQTKANQRQGLVPTIYYPAHQRLIAALKNSGEQA